MFHYESFAASYLAGAPVPRPALTAGRQLPLPSVLAEYGVDGDAYLVVDEQRITLDEVETAPRPLEVWSLQRRVLQRAADDASRFSDARGAWALRQVPGQGLLVEQGVGAFVVLGWRRAAGESAHELGSCALEVGARCAVDDGRLSGVDTLVLLRVERTLIEADGRRRTGPNVPAG